MKKLTLIFILLINIINCVSAQTVTPCLITNGVVTQGGCPPIGDAQLYFGNCISYLQPLIARSASAEGLSAWNTPQTCWGYCVPNPNTQTGFDPYSLQNIPPETNTPNCDIPYDLCGSTYCPNKYCDIIKSLVESRASMIVRAVNVWGDLGNIQPGTHFYKSMQQLVIDINAAYDCKYLRRPVIQGTILEYINDDFNAYNVPIPTDVIEEFKNTIGFDNSYYLLNGTPVPKNNLHFKLERIATDPKVPDITNIETKMFFYYLAKTFIDFGYKSIHMGQIWWWGKYDTNYTHTAILLDKIRNYASSLNTFVLLTEENEKALKYPNSNTFMFDYDSRALRIREVSNPQVNGDYDCVGQPTYTLTNAPVAFQYPGIIDYCVLQNAGCNSGNLDGYSPVNNCYQQNQPYNTYFDFGAGDLPPGQYIESQGEYCNQGRPEGTAGTWGFDDAKYFGYVLNKDQRKYWIGDAIERLKNYYQPNLNYRMGFMISPHLLNVNMPAELNNYLIPKNPTSSRRYLIVDEPTVLDEVNKKWLPNNNALISNVKNCINPSGICEVFPIIKFNKQNQYDFWIINPDNTTVYTWHLQNPDGSWQPYTYGTTRTIYPTVSGVYTLYLRQDNLGRYPSEQWYGIKTDSYKIFLYNKCCGNNNAQKGSDINYPQDLEGEIPMLVNDNLNEYNDYISGNIPYINTNDKLNVNANKINSSLDTEELKQNILSDIKIYPNPTSDKIFLDIPEFIFNGKEITFTVSDVYGNIILIQSSEYNKLTYNIDMSGKIPQLYFIRINDKYGKSRIFKFIKVK